ncbi:MAG: acyl-CoA thioesterase [Geobacter sp.]|nr:acyl-CoA thioesterase [Geobacter sp.]
MTSPAETSSSLTLPLGSNPALQHHFMVVDEPIPGNFRFGLLLEKLDLLAEQTALAFVRQSHPEGRVVTAAIDKIVVRNVADVYRDIICHACINHVGRSSLEVGIRVEQPGETVTHIASCYFTMVARGGAEANVSLQLPQLTYTTEQEQRRAAKMVTNREEYLRQQESARQPPSVEEYALLDALHRAQEEPGFTGLRAADPVTEAWERMYPEQEYVPHRIFGGYLMRRAFELSAICSELVAPNRSIISAVNRINFFHPVQIGDKLHFTSRVVFTSESFVCVETGIERISRDRTNKALSNSCLFTFVNVDKELNHCPVPPIYPASYREDTRYLDALRSYRTMSGHYRML